MPSPLGRAPGTDPALCHQLGAPTWGCPRSPRLTCRRPARRRDASARVRCQGRPHGVTADVTGRAGGTGIGIGIATGVGIATGIHTAISIATGIGTGIVVARLALRGSPVPSRPETGAVPAGGARTGRGAPCPREGRALWSPGHWSALQPAGRDRSGAKRLSHTSVCARLRDPLRSWTSRTPAWRSDGGR